jgi:hypothetical protein
MQIDTGARRLFNPPTALLFVAIACAALLGIYWVSVKSADLRPISQQAEGASITACIERYAPLQDNKVDIDLLWAAFPLCDAINSRRLLYEEQAIRNENFVFQRYENKIIMLMVVSVTISGVILAGLQLLGSYKIASAAKRSMDAAGEVNLGFNNLSVKSSVVGVIILAISFAFFLVYVLYVYTITPGPETGGAISTTPQRAGPPASGPQFEENVGKAYPSGQASPNNPQASPSNPPQPPPNNPPQASPNNPPPG